MSPGKLRGIATWATRSSSSARRAPRTAARAPSSSTIPCSRSGLHPQVGIIPRARGWPEQAADSQGTSRWSGPIALGRESGSRAAARTGPAGLAVDAAGLAPGARRPRASATGQPPATAPSSLVGRGQATCAWGSSRAAKHPSDLKMLPIPATSLWPQQRLTELQVRARSSACDCDRPADRSHRAAGRARAAPSRGSLRSCASRAIRMVEPPKLTASAPSPSQPRSRPAGPAAASARRRGRRCQLPAHPEVAVEGEAAVEVEQQVLAAALDRARASRPSSSAAASAAPGARGPGVRTDTSLPRQRASIAPGDAEDRVALGHLSATEAARLAPEAGLDQRGLHARADHRLAVDALDPQLLDHARRWRPRRARRARSIELLALELLEPQDPLAATLDVERAARRREASRRRPAVRARAGAGPRAWARRAWRRTGWPDRSRRGPGNSPSARGRLRRRSTAPGSANCAPAEPLDEVAAPGRAEQLEVRSSP